jgi:hypothetical protein
MLLACIAASALSFAGLQFAFARHLRRDVAQDHGIDHPAFGLQP